MCRRRDEGGFCQASNLTESRPNQDHQALGIAASRRRLESGRAASLQGYGSDPGLNAAHHRDTSDWNGIDRFRRLK